MGNSLDNEVLKQEILIVLGGGVDRIHDSGNHVLHTLHIGESGTEVFILNSDRILDTPVHGVESGTNIGDTTLQFTNLCLFSGELTSLGNLNEHLFNGFTELKITLFQFSISVIEDGTLDTNKCNTIQQGIEEVVGKIGITIDDFTDTRNVTGVVDFRNHALILIGSIRTNGIQNIKRGCVQLGHCDSVSH